MRSQTAAVQELVPQSRDAGAMVLPSSRLPRLRSTPLPPDHGQVGRQARAFKTCPIRCRSRFLCGSYVHSRRRTAVAVFLVMLPLYVSLIIYLLMTQSRICPSSFTCDDSKCSAPQDGRAPPHACKQAGIRMIAFLAAAPHTTADKQTQGAHILRIRHISKRKTQTTFPGDEYSWTILRHTSARPRTSRLKG